MAASLESLLNCPICMENLQRPKLLHCAHSFCQGCLEKMWKADDIIICPTCRYETPLPTGGVGQLLDDFRVAQLKEGLGNLMVQATNNCSVCSKGQATTCCLQCHKKMCDSCLARHNKRRNVAFHTVLRVEDLKECPKHRDYCGHVCANCNGLVCVTCLLDNCVNHDCKDLGEAARAYLEYGNGRSNLTTAMEKLYSQVRTDRVQFFTDIERQLDGHTDKMIAEIQKQRAVMRTELATKKQLMLQEIDKEEEKDMKMVAELRNVQATSLQNGIPSSLLKLLPTLHAWLLPSEPAKPDIAFYPHSALNLGKLGTIKAPKDTPAPPQHSASAAATSTTNTTAAATKVKSVAPATTSQPGPAGAQAERGGGSYSVLEKVVRDTQGNNDALIGLLMNVIIRLDYNPGDTHCCVRIYENGIHRDYFEQLDTIDRFRCIRDSPDYRSEINFMAEQMNIYLCGSRSPEPEVRDHGFRFDKVVHDHRRNMNALIGRIGDIIIRNDFNSSNRCCFIFVCGQDAGYAEEATLVSRFPAVAPRSYEEHVAFMEREVQDFATENGIDLHPDNDAASYSSNDSYFDARQEARPKYFDKALIRPSSVMASDSDTDWRPRGLRVLNAVPALSSFVYIRNCSDEYDSDW